MINRKATKTISFIVCERKLISKLALMKVKNATPLVQGIVLEVNLHRYRLSSESPRCHIYIVVIAVENHTFFRACRSVLGCCCNRRVLIVSCCNAVSAVAEVQLVVRYTTNAFRDIPTRISWRVTTCRSFAIFLKIKVIIISRVTKAPNWIICGRVATRAGIAVAKGCCGTLTLTRGLDRHLTGS